MNFYETILPWYDQIFPLSPAQLDFVLSFGESPDLSVVDVGCGTGSLIVELAKVFRKTAGLDPDGAMLEAARRKAAAGPAGTWFIQAGMLDLAKEFAPQSVDRLICFGNTLPHLANETEVAEFARQASRILKPSGLLLVQIISYDRILDQKLGGLPTIETEEFSFERRYLYPENPTHVRFVTRLTLKSSGEVIENEVPLLAIRPARLRQILENAGFSGVEEFGSFKKDSVTLDSQPFIIKARIPVD
jgi:ubiquinone/menaquinone biosynthesis C-methylase UbiE